MGTKSFKEAVNVYFCCEVKHESMETDSLCLRLPLKDVQFSDTSVFASFLSSFLTFKSAKDFAARLSHYFLK